MSAPNDGPILTPRRLPGPVGVIGHFQNHHTEGRDSRGSRPAARALRGSSSGAEHHSDSRTNASNPATLCRETPPVEEQPAWLCMCASLDLRGTAHDFPYNTQYVKSIGYKGKIPQFVGVVKSFRHAEGQDYSATLEDLQGDIGAYFHRFVIEEYGGVSRHQKDKTPDLGVGAVVVLRQVSVFTPSSTFGRKHYLNVTLDNVVRVFRADSKLPNQTPVVGETPSAQMAVTLAKNTERTEDQPPSRVSQAILSSQAGASRTQPEAEFQASQDVTSNANGTEAGSQIEFESASLQLRQLHRLRQLDVEPADHTRRRREVFGGLLRGHSGRKGLLQDHLTNHQTQDNNSDPKALPASNKQATDGRKSINSIRARYDALAMESLPSRLETLPEDDEAELDALFEDDFDNDQQTPSGYQVHRDLSTSSTGTVLKGSVENKTAAQKPTQMLNADEGSSRTIPIQVAEAHMSAPAGPNMEDLERDAVAPLSMLTHSPPSAKRSSLFSIAASTSYKRLGFEQNALNKTSSYLSQTQSRPPSLSARLQKFRYTENTPQNQDAGSQKLSAAEFQLHAQGTLPSTPANVTVLAPERSMLRESSQFVEDFDDISALSD